MHSKVFHNLRNPLCISNLLSCNYLGLALQRSDEYGDFLHDLCSIRTNVNAILEHVSLLV